MAAHNEAALTTEGDQIDKITAFERNHTTTRLILAISKNTIDASESLHFNLALHAKWIEKNIYIEAETKGEYSKLVADKIREIEDDMEGKNQMLKENPSQNVINLSRASSSRNIQEWRYFYSPGLRTAVVNGFIKDLISRVDMPSQHDVNLRFGIEALEDITFKRARSKHEYFGVLEREKNKMAYALSQYFRNDF